LREAAEELVMMNVAMRRERERVNNNNIMKMKYILTREL
jgi:hypothetical protein